MVSLPFNYFHLYKYYDGVISFTPTRNVYRPLDNVTYGGDVVIKNLYAKNVQYIQSRTLAYQDINYKFYSWFKIDHGLLNLSVQCMMCFNTKVSDAEYEAQFNEYTSGHLIVQNDIDTFRNYAVLIQPVTQITINVGQVLNAFDKYILYCLCGDENYYVLGHDFVSIVDQSTINNIINLSTFIYSYDQYRTISSLSYF